MSGGSVVGFAAADRQGTESGAAAAAMIICVFTASHFFWVDRFISKSDVGLSMILACSDRIDPVFLNGV
jgi:hypothetical protein